MNSISDKISDSIPDLIEDGSSKQSIPDDYQSISTSQQPFDPSSYFDNPPFDDGLFRSFKGYEPYHSGLGYDPATTAMPSPTIHATSATCLPPGRNQEFPFRTRSDPQVPQSISAISSSFNEWLPSPNQYSADIGFGTSNEMESGAGTQIQSVRNSQLEKRRAQNRNSQRAFRERKESYTNYLERELLCLREKYDKALRCLARLKAAYAALESLDKFDSAFNEPGMGIVAEELEREV